MKRVSLYLLTLLLVVSCNDNSTIAYKYSSNPEVFECDYDQMELVKEALYAYEAYILEHHNFKGPKSLERGYANYWAVAMSDRLPFIEKFDDHIKLITEALFQEEELWTITDGKASLNVYSEFGSCVVENFKNEDLKATMNALIDTRTFRSDIFIPSIRRKTMQMLDDKAMATYVALDLFYAKLYNLDLNEPATQPAPAEDDHAGHNH